MDINVKIYVNGKNYKTLCKTVINADTVQCEISFDNHSFDVEFDNTAITLKNIDGLKVDTVKTLRFKANFTSMKKFKWDLMEIVIEIVGLLADRHIGYKNMEELYDNAIKNHCIKPEATESETATEPETADQGETSESVTKQYECENVVQVAHKVADLTNTLIDRQTWKGYCDEVKRDGSSWFDYTAFDSGGNEFDVSIFLGYDQQCRHYFVSVDYEKCPVPDISGGA